MGYASIQITFILVFRIRQNVVLLVSLVVLWQIPVHEGFRSDRFLIDQRIIKLTCWITDLFDEEGFPSEDSQKMA